MKASKYSYEKMIDELKEIVEKLEDNSTTIEEGINKFKEGLDITKNCVEYLEKAKVEIFEIKDQFDKVLNLKVDDFATEENKNLENENEDLV